MKFVILGFPKMGVTPENLPRQFIKLAKLGSILVGRHRLLGVPRSLKSGNGLPSLAGATTTIPWHPHIPRQRWLRWLHVARIQWQWSCDVVGVGMRFTTRSQEYRFHQIPLSLYIYTHIYVCVDLVNRKPTKSQTIGKEKNHHQFWGSWHWANQTTLDQLWQPQLLDLMRRLSSLTLPSRTTGAWVRLRAVSTHTFRWLLEACQQNFGWINIYGMIVWCSSIQISLFGWWNSRLTARKTSHPEGSAAIFTLRSEVPSRRKMQQVERGCLPCTNCMVTVPQDKHLASGGAGANLHTPSRGQIWDPSRNVLEYQAIKWCLNLLEYFWPMRIVGSQGQVWPGSRSLGPYNNHVSMCVSQQERAEKRTPVTSVS